MVEGGDYIPIATLQQNDSCIKMDSDVSHFNDSFVTECIVYMFRAMTL